MTARPQVEGLDLAHLGPGRHECWLHLVDSALGAPERLPLLVIRGHRPGPVVGLTAAVHGDEVNGIAVIHELMRKLDPEKLRGTVAALPVVNLPAFRRHDRLTPQGQDLNHNFPGVADGNDVQVYAYRLMTRFVAHLDVLIDLHTASRGRANCLYIRADMLQEDTARMAYLQRPQIILHNPANDQTLRGAAVERGVPAITVEVGNPSRFQREYIRRSVAGIRAVLAQRRMLPRRQMSFGPPPLICSESKWLYTDCGGLLTVFPDVTTTVREGEVIAEIVDPFGQRLRTFTAPFEGVVIGRAVDPVAHTGARILHLGRLADDHVPYVRRDENA